MCEHPELQHVLQPVLLRVGESATLQQDIGRSHHHKYKFGRDREKRRCDVAADCLKLVTYRQKTQLS